MTEEQRKLCGMLVMFPDGKRRITKEEFLRQFPSAVECGRSAVRFLEDAYRTKNESDLEGALIIGCTFGFPPEHKDILCRLIDEDWHCWHESVVSILSGLWPTPDTVEALFRATQWVPKSLEYDDGKAMARKAIYALGKIPGPEAETKLEILARSDDPVLRGWAVKQLERRRTTT